MLNFIWTCFFGRSSKIDVRVLKSGLLILARDLRLSGLVESLDGSQQPLSKGLSHLLVCAGTVKSLQRRTQFSGTNSNSAQSKHV